MNVDSIDLLRQLAGASVIGRPGFADPAQAQAPDEAPFAELLRQASAGTIPNSRRVTVQSGAGVSLTDGQLMRLSAAADRAEAAGLRTALVLVDGQRLVLDVHSREVTGKALDAGGVVGGVDGLIDLGYSGAQAGAAGVAPSTQFSRPPVPAVSTLTGNASLARLLQGIGTG